MTGHEQIEVVHDVPDPTEMGGVKNPRSHARTSIRRRFYGSVCEVCLVLLDQITIADVGAKIPLSKPRIMVPSRPWRKL